MDDQRTASRSPLSGWRSVALAAALAAAVIAAIVWTGGSHPGGESGGGDAFARAGVTRVNPDTRGPAFRLLEFPGARHRSLDDYAGSLVVLNFWATWCGPCTTEMPALEALWRRYRSRGLVVLAVSVDRGAAPTIVEPYLRQHGLTFPVLLDPDMGAAREWRVTGLPATFLVAPGGAIRGAAIGAREWDSPAMRGLVETLLPVRAAAARP